MGEFEEFAEALFGQLSVEINEEKEIIKLAGKAKEDLSGKVNFKKIEKVAYELLPEFRHKVEDLLGVKCADNIKFEFLELDALKKFKGSKVFAETDAKMFVEELFAAVGKEDLKKIAGLMRQDAGKYLVYSTYAIQYISKITTTYGDYLDGVIYLNKFILSRYPQIILQKQGEPYDLRFESVNSGYLGAIKMTIIEGLIHSVQGNLQQINKRAATEVNRINEELANIILSLDIETVNKLSEYCQLQPVPDDLPFAKKANLFFFLNPDHFLIEQIGPDVMTFTHVKIDPKIDELIPQLSDIYKGWLAPIQLHHAAFTTMEGIAEFATENVLKGDDDFQNYLTTYMGTDFSSYQKRNSEGKDFTKAVFEKLGKGTFKKIMETPPNTRELKDPQSYINKLSR